MNNTDILINDKDKIQYLKSKATFKATLEDKNGPIINLVHYLSDDGTELGYISFNHYVKLFEVPRIWSKEIKAQYNITFNQEYIG